MFTQLLFLISATLAISLFFRIVSTILYHITLALNELLCNDHDSGNTKSIDLFSSESRSMDCNNKPLKRAMQSGTRSIPGNYNHGGFGRHREQAIRDDFNGGAGWMDNPFYGIMTAGDAKGLTLSLSDQILKCSNHPM